MDRLAILTENFTDTDDQASQVRTWQERYETLIAKLGTLGTEVRRVRLTEKDRNTAPYRFIERGCHVFIFPPQKPSAESAVISDVDHTPGFEARKEVIARTVDETRLAGQLLVTYDDADGKIDFTVSDGMHESLLSPEVMAALEEAGLMQAHAHK